MFTLYIYIYIYIRYPYYDVGVGLVWSHEPDSYADGILATGRASHARHVKGDDQTKRNTLLL